MDGLQSAWFGSVSIGLARLRSACLGFNLSYCFRSVRNRLLNSPPSLLPSLLPSLHFGRATFFPTFPLQNSASSLRKLPGRGSPPWVGAAGGSQRGETFRATFRATTRPTTRPTGLGLPTWTGGGRTPQGCEVPALPGPRPLLAQHCWASSAWAGRPTAAFDTSIVAPLETLDVHAHHLDASNNRSFSNELRNRDNRKKATYEEVCRRQGRTFLPLGFSVFGALSECYEID